MGILRSSNIPSQETIERFIARVEDSAHVEAIREFYTEEASMQENNTPPRVGRDVLVKYEREVLSRVNSVQSTSVGPVLVDGDTVVIRWIFQFEWKDGSVTRMEELAYQRWEGERIQSGSIMIRRSASQKGLADEQGERVSRRSRATGKGPRALTDARFQLHKRFSAAFTTAL